MRPSLSLFDAWAIHNVKREFVENPSGGPMRRAFSELAAAKLVHVYVVGVEDDPKYDKAVERFRDRLSAACFPVFYFRDGQIMFLRTAEPGSIIQRRYARELQAFENWAILDNSMETFSSSHASSGEVWKETELEGLYFEDDGAEDNGEDNEVEDDDFDDDEDEDDPEEGGGRG
jgi:hypothetical protein